MFIPEVKESGLGIVPTSSTTAQLALGDAIAIAAMKYKKFDKKVPLIVVPSSYNSVTEDILIKKGANIVIYANHLLRSAYPAMVKTAESILKNKRSKEASDDYCMSIKEILNNWLP